MSRNAPSDVVSEIKFPCHIEGSEIEEDSSNSDALFGYDENSEDLSDNEDEPTFDRFVGPLLCVNNFQ